jgi:hypothetical protein
MDAKKPLHVRTYKDNLVQSQVRVRAISVVKLLTMMLMQLRDVSSRVSSNTQQLYDRGGNAGRQFVLHDVVSNIESHPRHRANARWLEAEVE